MHASIPGPTPVARAELSRFRRAPLAARAERVAERRRLNPRLCAIGAPPAFARELGAAARCFVAQALAALGGPRDSRSAQSPAPTTRVPRAASQAAQ
eukprot:9350973-Pyramimonas_sp.AAC.1